MTADELQQIWRQHYQIVPEQLRKTAEISRAATAFNTNIDAVIKLSGARLAALATAVGLTPADLANTQTKLNSPQDVVRGIIKCFSLGIAEEWLCSDKAVYEWMQTNLGYDRLQMGGQAGIIGNVLAVLGIRNVCVHTASHPQIQAEQFIDADNLLAFAENGDIRKARAINRNTDEPLIHWIIEFAAGDSFEFCGQTYTCPRDNRFIATYDTANTELKINAEFIKHLHQHGFEYLILSGFHALTVERGGLQRIDEIVPILKQLKQANPRGIIHLELASTQDTAVRTAILEKLTPLVDSLGFNEREALDALEICAPQTYNTLKARPLTAPLLLEILLKLKQKLQTPRMQLHFLGMYLTLQNKGLHITPEQSRRGMMLAATIAASKAGLGNIESKENLLWAYGKPVGLKAVDNLQTLAAYLKLPSFAADGITEYGGFDLIAVPTILIDKPLTLVGMGDTISSVSLLGAR